MSRVASEKPTPQETFDRSALAAVQLSHWGHSCIMQHFVRGKELIHAKLIEIRIGSLHSRIPAESHAQKDCRMPMYPETRDRLTALSNFGTDPGSLSADIYIPKNFPKNGPLVVVLHGSTQSAGAMREFG